LTIVFALALMLTPSRLVGVMFRTKHLQGR
jgi:hypothetical protein